MTNPTPKNKPVILITNDDSFSAGGIRKLISLMRPLGKVVVVASEFPMSGMGHAITIKTPLRLKKVAEDVDYEEYVCNGTPVDCVKLGSQVVLKRKPDLLVSGINHGSNASINVIYSGTMAAVLEACIDGIPAIGFSLLEYSLDANFDHVDQYVIQITEKVLTAGLPDRVCLNVNIPALSKDLIKGVQVCRQAHARWVEEFDSRLDPRGGDYHWLTGRFENDDRSEDTDQYALENNYVSVVPVHYDLTAHHAIEKIKNWKL